MRNGSTLIELLLALAILGMLVALAGPGVSALRDQLAVHDAAERIAGAHARARFVASTEARVTVLGIWRDSLVLRAVESPADTTFRWRAPGPASDRVAVTGTPHTIAFAPSGVALGAGNQTYGLSRGTATRQVIVSRYGRVRIN